MDFHTRKIMTKIIVEMIGMIVITKALLLIVVGDLRVAVHDNEIIGDVTRSVEARDDRGHCRRIGGDGVVGVVDENVRVAGRRRRGRGR